LTLVPEEERLAMGRRAAEVVGQWGPDRFAQGIVEGLELAHRPRNSKLLTLEKSELSR
jgi:hypothetical protein